MASGGQQLDARNVEIWANTKLGGDWSAPSVVPQLDGAKLSLLVSVFSDGNLDQLVKVRLLIACELLPAARKTELSAELASLAESARADDDEWVRVMGCAVGDFSGQLDLDAVKEDFSMVRERRARMGAWGCMDAWMHGHMSRRQILNWCPMMHS
jgi:hypothetical protein